MTNFEYVKSGDHILANVFWGGEEQILVCHLAESPSTSSDLLHVDEIYDGSWRRELKGYYLWKEDCIKKLSDEEIFKLLMES